MKDEEIKREIKETVTKLANVNLEFTIEDELEFAKVAVNKAEQKLREKEQKLDKIKDYCKKNKVAGWVDIEGIIERIEGESNE